MNLKNETKMLKQWNSVWSERVFGHITYTRILADFTLLVACCIQFSVKWMNFSHRYCCFFCDPNTHSLWRNVNLSEITVEEQKIRTVDSKNKEKKNIFYFMLLMLLAPEIRVFNGVTITDCNWFMKNRLFI